MKGAITRHAVFAILASAALARADVVLMLDFGPTTATGSSLTNSPYHTVNPLFEDTTWNRVQADTASGLLWSDGSAATGVSLDIGASSDFTTLNLEGTFTSSALGGQVNTGVYTNTSVGRDGIFNGTSGQARQIGLQIAGLPAGEYDVYMVGRNTSTVSSNNPIFYAGTTSAAGNFNFTAYDAVTISYGPGSTANTDGWVEDGGVGENYAKFTVTLDDGDYLNLVVQGSFGESRGFLNAVQIVTVPEPSTVVLWGLGMAALLLRRRRPASR